MMTTLLAPRSSLPLPLDGARTNDRTCSARNGGPPKLMERRASTASRGARPTRAPLPTDQRDPLHRPALQSSPCPDGTAPVHTRSHGFQVWEGGTAGLPRRVFRSWAPGRSRWGRLLGGRMGWRAQGQRAASPKPRYRGAARAQMIPGDGWHQGWQHGRPCWWSCSCSCM